MWKTGHSLIKAKMKETGAPLAGEMSGHIFFADGWYGFDDALYAAVRLLRHPGALGGAADRDDRPMPPVVNTPEMRFQVDEAASSRSSRRCWSGCAGAAPRSTHRRRAGQHADGWWLLRASNTQDVLVARAEARTRPGSSA